MEALAKKKFLFVWCRPIASKHTGDPIQKDLGWFQSITPQEFNPNGQHNNSHLELECPPKGYTKSKLDVAIDKTYYKVGIAIVVNDWKGHVSATLRATRDLFPYAYLAETLAALEVLILTIEFGLCWIILERDALRVVKVV